MNGEKTTVVVTQEHLAQIVQGIYENVKSNQHRLDEVEPMLSDISRSVNELNTLLVKNGYAQAVKDGAKEIKALRTEFQAFQLSRADSCPTMRSLVQQQQREQEKRSSSLMLARIGISLLAAIPALLFILDRIYGG
jgi:hypothetical protein